jgi:thymidine kinase
MNARTVDGVIQREGEQVVVGDVGAGDVAYEVLCRRHHREGVTSALSDRTPDTSVDAAADARELSQER